MRVSLLQLDLDVHAGCASVYYELADITLTNVSRALGAQAHKELHCCALMQCALWQQPDASQKGLGSGAQQCYLHTSIELNS